MSTQKALEGREEVAAELTAPVRKHWVGQSVDRKRNPDPADSASPDSFS